MSGNWPAGAASATVIFQAVSGLQYSITAVGSVILQVAVNSLGSIAVASVAAASKIQGFLCCPYDAMGATMATYGGQIRGAEILRVCLLIQEKFRLSGRFTCI